MLEVVAVGFWGMCVCWHVFNRNRQYELLMETLKFVADRVPFMD